MMNTTVFSENLRRFRQHKGLTQEQAASALGVNAQTVSRWECGSGCPDRHTSAYSQPVFCNSHDFPLR